MHYRQRSVLFASGGITVADLDKPELLIAALLSASGSRVGRLSGTIAQATS
ncbi:hypothetical protein HJB96_32390 [Rhizobium sp. NLR15a]|uniref:hypothetical protein n=1 Tax=Rhizobium sp. NLR15a TaxID=2731111 RepID=UPI001C83765B|nr:hypothetical protein [Rhizobium sp. NLR15a]MBX5297552.1 hypothetical protein [Rhizobium sp. NLR15a]